MKNCIKNLRTKIIALVVLVVIIILCLGTYITYAATTTYSLGDNVEGTLNNLTGELTIQSTSGVGTIREDISNVFGESVVENNIINITFNNKVKLDTNAILFFCMENLKNINNINYLDTSNLTSTWAMFYGCKNLTSLDLSNFNTSNVESMNFMFEGCSSLQNIDVSKFDTSNVRDMDKMFSGCSSLQSIDVSKFDTSNVTGMVLMFDECSSLQSLDLSNFDTSNVKDMGCMFYECENLTSLNLSSFNTSNVNDDGMWGMFYGCKNLTSLDLSKFDTSNVKDMGSMFYECENLTSLNLSSFNTSNVEDMKYMFEGCSILESLDLSNFDMSKVTDTSDMLYRTDKLDDIYTPYKYSSKVIELPGQFKNMTDLTDTKVYTNISQNDFDESVHLKKITSNQNTITFYNEEGTKVLGTSKVDYGTNANDSGINKVKAEDNTYTYTFEKWVTEVGGTIEDDLSNVISDRNVYAKYTPTYKKYEVKFVDEDGRELSKKLDYHYGDAIVLPAEPTKPSIADSTYIFAGWSEDGINVIDLSMATVEGNKQYKAVYTSTTNKYTVTFYNEEGTTKLGESTVNYGANASDSTITKTKPEDNIYTYAFDKWVTTQGGKVEDDLSNVIANRNVYATYIPTYKEYEVEFVNEDGTQISIKSDYHYGDTLVLPSEPIREGYKFDGWYVNGTKINEGETVKISSDTVVTAHWKEDTTDKDDTDKDDEDTTDKDDTDKDNEDTTDKDDTDKDNEDITDKDNTDKDKEDTANKDSTGKDTGNTSNKKDTENSNVTRKTVQNISAPRTLPKTGKENIIFISIIISIMIFGVVGYIKYVKLNKDIK